MSQKQQKSGYQRKTDHGNVDEDALIAALKAVKLANQSIRASALAFQIPRSTLQRHIDRFDETENDIITMTDAQLLDFVQNRQTYGTHLKVKLN